MRHSMLSGQRQHPHLAWDPGLIWDNPEVTSLLPIGAVSLGRW
jgi:hypothetical protein